jgi:hypothetical protein
MLIADQFGRLMLRFADRSLGPSSASLSSTPIPRPARFSGHETTVGEGTLRENPGSYVRGLRIQSYGELVLDQSEPDGASRCGGAGVDSHLLQDVFNVGRHGAVADEEFAGNLAVGPAIGHQPQDFELA